MSSNNTNQSIELVSNELVKLHERFEKEHEIHLKYSTIERNRCLESIKILLNILIPGRYQDIYKVDPKSIRENYTLALRQIATSCEKLELKLDQDHFNREFLKIAELIRLDAVAAFRGDPAATSVQEVMLSYPGVFAIACHRIAHILYFQKIPILPRIISEWSHSKTGIDIHPGARIGESFFIDHGTGVVIGETTEIANRVTLYQGVTLGSKNFPLDENGIAVKGIKRHPTVESNVIIYANTIVLGGKTVIGENTTIGGNLFITQSIPKDSLVFDQPATEQTYYKVLSKKRNVETNSDQN